MKPDLVNVFIDSLKLHGFSSIDSLRIRDSFERRFQELASQEQHLSDLHSRKVRDISLPSLKVTPHTLPHDIGRETANRLWINLFHD